MFKLHVVLENSEEIQRLRDEVAFLECEFQSCKSELAKMTNNYCEEVHLNSRLIDLLRAHDVDWRSE